MMLQFYESPFHATETAEMANNMVLRADIMTMIRDIIERKQWTQQQAANKLCISQPHVSDLINGKMEKFTLDFLMTILNSLDFKVRFSFGDIDNANISIKHSKNESI